MSLYTKDEMVYKQYICLIRVDINQTSVSLGILQFKFL